MTPLRLRLFHAADGARVAYREAGVGPGLVLLHCARAHRTASSSRSSSTSPTASASILPDLPLHGDSEDRPRHPYTLDWLAEVMAAFCVETAGPAAARRRARRRAPRCSCAPSRTGQLHARAARPHADAAAPPAAAPGPPRPRARRRAARARCPGLDRAIAHARALAVRPERGHEAHGARQPRRARPRPPRDGRRRRQRRTSRARGRALARAWPGGAQRRCSTSSAAWTCPSCCCGPTRTRAHPLATAEEALDLLPDGQLRVLPGTGFLIAYDDPVGVARELVAFCG